MTKPRVVITRIPPGHVLERVYDTCDVWEWPENRALPREQLLEVATTAEGLYCMLTDRVDAELLSLAPQLRVVSQMAVGVDNIDLLACTNARVPVGHTPDVLTETTADTGFALLAAVARRIPEGARYVLEGRWRDWSPGLLLGDDLHHTAIGILGMGRIGAAIARRARGFSMDIYYSAPQRKLDAEKETGAVHVSFDELLVRSDHLMITAPLIPETHHIINASTLAKMKPTATLVNISRGPLVDCDALADALVKGTIGRAALDVTDPEPIPSGHRLLELPNCLVIPHLGSASWRTREKMGTLAVENLLAGLVGSPLVCCANPDVYQ